jgi:hypothetical protein
MIADGHSTYEVTQYLRRSGASSPDGTGGRCYRTTIRNIILSNTYLGTFWWGKKKRTTTTVSVVESGERTYRKKVKREERSREEWTATPVPDSGIPPETTASTREAIEENTWPSLGTLRLDRSVRALWFPPQDSRYFQRCKDRVLLLYLSQVNIQPGQRHLPRHKALPGRGPGVASQGHPRKHSPPRELYGVPQQDL